MTAAAGAEQEVPLGADGMPSPGVLWEALEAVKDPELGYNIVDLGLVYDITKPVRGKVHVLMTLTSIGCPFAEAVQQHCALALTALPGSTSSRWSSPSPRPGPRR